MIGVLGVGLKVIDFWGSFQFLARNFYYKTNNLKSEFIDAQNFESERSQIDELTLISSNEEEFERS